MFSPAVTDPPAAALRKSAARLLKVEVASLDRIAGGRNSLVFRVRTTAGRSFALKAYFRHKADSRDRLGTEFNCLRLLWKQGFRDIPKPLAADRRAGVALYEFIPGSPPQRPGAADVMTVVDFLCRLRDLARSPACSRLNPASEACFSIASLVELLKKRLARLSESEGSARNLAALRTYLDEEFAPALKRFIAWSRGYARRTGIGYDRKLPRRERTLSPSDFGFHNALRRPGGGLVFLDFEYFGWDDPAKMIVDFLLHPAKPISARLKRLFVSEMLNRFSEWPKLRQRVEAVYPLFGLKWCLILLNEFLPADLRRRQFAVAGHPDREALQRRQLAKSRQLLRRLGRDHASFFHLA